MTHQFMSLESELAGLTAAINNLAARLAGGLPTTAVTATTAVTTVEPTPEPKKEKAKKDKPAETPSAPPSADEHEKLAEPVVQALLDAGKKAAILDLNAKYGVKKGRELFGTEKFDAYLADLKKL